MNHTSHFINADFEIESHYSLDVLVHELESSLCLLHYAKYGNKRFRATFETNDPWTPKVTPEKIILKICEHLESLSKQAKNDLKKSIIRRFDLGFEGNGGKQNFNTSITVPTLKRISHLGCDIAITIYRIAKN